MSLQEDGADDMKESQVEEAGEILSIIRKVVASDGKAAAISHDRWKAILYKYQEQSELLDAILDDIVTPLSCLLRKLSVTESLHEGGMPSVLSVCRLLHVLVIVRGYKTVVKFFQHEAADLEKVLNVLMIVRAQGVVSSEDGCASWEAQTILLLWLSILILTPFALSTVDSDSEATPTSKYTALVGKVMSLCKEYLSHPGGMREMGALLLGRMLTRPDQGPALQEFLDWAPEALATAEGLSAAFLVPGIIQALAHIFKLGARASLLHYAPRVWTLLAGMLAGEGLMNKSLAHKLAIKLAQRLALTFMEPRQAPWRYQKDDVDLDAALALGQPTEDAPGGAEAAEEVEDDFEVAEEIEEVIECVLGALRDKDTIVRWSAAKGVGRITSCLPRELGDEVVGHVLQLFRPTESDAAWHGGCLALAELSRRGLLLPDRLPVVVPIVQQALQYDVRRGPHSIGAHVRDAAAYVCWACARAYAPAVLEDSVQVLAAGLLTVACYDREVNCRRAAAAAFQEAVGRLGNFPHGMDILAVADYFTVGNVNQAYLHVSPHVCSFPEYRVTLTCHLISIKLRHWEKSMRELAARAAAALVGVHAEYMATDVLDELLPLCLDAVLEVRHGAVLGVAELLPALHAAGHDITPDRVAKIAEVTPAIDKARLYRGKGGEIMREAVSKLIGAMASMGLPMKKSQHGKVLEALDENMRHPQPFIQSSAADAMGQYAKAYITRPEEVAEFGSKHLESYMSRLHDPNVAIRRGYAAVMGSLPNALIRPFAEKVVHALVDGATPEEGVDERDVESRVQCLNALGRVCTTLCADALGQRVDGELFVQQVLPCLHEALNDYTTDNRGDVGSTVREASMRVLAVLLPLLAESPSLSEARKEELLPAIMTRAIGALLKQGVERIGRTREAAIRHIMSLLRYPAVKHRVTECDVVSAALPSVMQLTGVASLDAAESHKWIPRIVSLLLEQPAYTASVLEGLVASVGGVDQSLAKLASAALVDSIHMCKDPIPVLALAASTAPSTAAAEATPSKRTIQEAVAEHLLEIWDRHAKSARMSTPLLRTAKLLASKTAVCSAQIPDEPPQPNPSAAPTEGSASGAAPTHDSVPDATATPGGSCMVAAHDAIVKLVRVEMRGCSDIVRLMDVAAALCQLLLFPNPCHVSSVQGLLLLLVSRYPKVRRYTAEQMYLQLLVMEPEELGGADADVTAEAAEEAQELVLTSNWDGDLESARAARDQLSALLQVAVPATKVKGGAAGAAAGAVRDENASYASLIDDFSRFRDM